MIAVMLARLLLGIPVAALLWTGTAQAQEDAIEVSVADRLSNVTTLLVGRPVELVASAHVGTAAPGCRLQDFRGGDSLSATVQLPPGAVLEEGASPTQQLELPANRRDIQVLNARWTIRIAEPGILRGGSVEVTGTSARGRSCQGRQRNFRIAAVTGRPRLRVVEYVNLSFDRDSLTAIVEQRLPGLSRDATEHEADDAFNDAIQEAHDPEGEEFGRGLLNLLSVRYRGRTLPVPSATTFEHLRGDVGYACIDLVTPRPLRSGRLPYTIRFSWNREKGFVPRTRRGSAPVRPRLRPRTAAGRGCRESAGF